MMKQVITRDQRRKDRIRVGIPFGSPKICSYSIDGKPVVCKDKSEHGRLIREKRLIEAGGKRKCWICQEHDDIENLVITVSSQAYHAKCRWLYEKCCKLRLVHQKLTYRPEDVIEA